MWGTYLYGGVTSSQSFIGVGASPPDPDVGRPTVVAPTKIKLREYPPLRLTVSVKTPDQHTQRWGSTAFDPMYAVSNLSCSTTMPGGFEHADMKLVRDVRRDWPDLDELETLTIQGVGGSVAWEGRLETIPSVAGNQLSISPGASGWQGHLDDDNGAREIFVEINLGNWQAASIQRKINLLNANVDIDDASARGEPSGTPAVDCELSGPWSREHISEAWYDANGIALGKLIYKWETSSPGKIGDSTPSDTNWSWQALLSTDDVAGAYDGSGNLRAAGPGSGTVNATTQTRAWAMVQLAYLAAGGGNGVLYDVFWTMLQLFGTHGLTTHTTVDGTQGLLGSDILSYAIPKYAPKLAVRRAGQATIVPSTFVIPELVYLTPVTSSQIVKDVTQYELQDWGVWEGPTFWWYPRGMFGKNWRARIGPTQLNNAGPQIDRLWNGVIVTYTDVLGVSRTAGPTGSGCTVTDPGLAIADPANPINELGIKKWAPLSMLNTSTASAAIQVGKIFLEEQAIVNTSGSATLNGYVEDDKGVVWPAWMVRAGDFISFVDAADPSYRRIVSTNYNDDSKSNAITLDTPPDSLQAILSRLQVVLAPITGG